VIARLLTDSFHRMLWLSVVIGAACGFVGVYLSYYLNWSSGASVVLTASALFVVAFVVSGARGRRMSSAGVDLH
jgi:ABC-type Mn2+/Zn2+ transport system permease subunit